MSYSSQVSLPPKITDREYVEPLLCGPGPCNLLPSVRAALSGPITQPMDDEYFDVVGDIRVGIQYAFQTKSQLVLAISGAGHTGMETVISNLLAPGETILIAARGIWDERASIMSRRYGLNAIVHQIPIYATFTFEDLETQLAKHRPKALYITHGDSSTGTVQKLEGLGHICHKYGALLITDTVVSLGGVPFLMDEWGVDAVFTSSQKALSGPAGISPVAFSARAKEIIKNRKHEPPFYFDVKILAQQWNCYGNTRLYHHTMCPPLLHALRASLKELCAETLPVAWARHAETVKKFHSLLEKLPVTFMVPKPEDRLPTVTTVLLPKGYEYLDVIKYIRNKHQIMIYGGLGPTAGKTLRIGIMGVNSRSEVAIRVAEALEDALKALHKAKL